MSGSICLGFESAQLAWRRVGECVAQDNPADEKTPPLLVRLLFETGKEIDLSAVPPTTRVTRAPRRIHMPTFERLVQERPELADEAQLCVSRREGRRWVDGADCRLMAGSYPVGSFCRLDEDVLITSPELTFLQMARSLDEVMLVAYGHELCGYFARTSGEHGFCNCAPLTSVSRIMAYLERLERQRGERGEGMPWGFARARRAVEHVRDGAASPEEAVVSMVLTLPRRAGGYGLPPARLNETVRLGSASSKTLGDGLFVCDLSWNGGAQVLEYQGAQHKRRSRRTYDRRKENVLAADGRTVFGTERGMLTRRELADELAHSLSLALGVRWREPDAALATRQLRLRNRLVAYLDER